MADPTLAAPFLIQPGQKAGISVAHVANALAELDAAGIRQRSVRKNSL
jgi:hypothetical protein